VTVRSCLAAALLATAAVGLLGCEQPPAREIEAAQAQLDAARKEGAERYAPIRWRDAQSAMQAARDRVAAKDYRGALSSANAAAEHAGAAIKAVRAARELAQGRTETAQAEVRALLEELDTIRQEAAVAKVPDTAFADLDPRVEEVKAALETVTRTLARDPLAAQAEAADLKSRASDLPTSFRQAQAKWQAEHRQARRPRRRR
jgi:hypothetical protein